MDCTRSQFVPVKCHLMESSLRDCFVMGIDLLLLLVSIVISRYIDAMEESGPCLQSWKAM